MNEETTYRPQAAQGSGELLMQKELSPAQEPDALHATVAQAAQAQGMVCPYCNTINDADATFCANCGKPLQLGVCPNCGCEIDMEADFCEVCHHYIKNDACSFCGAVLSPDDVFCPECGNPRGGIVCPNCNTLNDFSFCKQCGTPLTEEARMMVEAFKHQPEYQRLKEAAAELDELNMELPYYTERDVVRDQMNAKLRERILTLLAKDRGVLKPVIPPVQKKRLSKEELEKRREELQQQLSAILDRIATPEMPSPVKARNYAMAQKPIGVRLAWLCNYKHAMHSSPCGCAKPQMGGKWVILGKKQEVKDDQ